MYLIDLLHASETQRYGNISKTVVCHVSWLPEGLLCCILQSDGVGCFENVVRVVNSLCQGRRRTELSKEYLFSFFNRDKRFYVVRTLFFCSEEVTVKPCSHRRDRIELNLTGS